MLGITHNPFMPKLFKQAQQPPGAAKVQERIAMMRARLARHKPDVLITIGNDHLHQFFMDNMPAFMIGKMDREELVKDYKAKAAVAGYPDFET